LELSLESTVVRKCGHCSLRTEPAWIDRLWSAVFNEISGDWGGKAYTDIMNGVAAVLTRNKFLGRNRIGAAGASYGGYMIDWIEGHNNDPRFQFKVLVSHDGVYNLTSMTGRH